MPHDEFGLLKNVFGVEEPEPAAEVNDPLNPPLPADLVAAAREEERRFFESLPRAKLSAIVSRDTLATLNAIEDAPPPEVWPVMICIKCGRACRAPKCVGCKSRTIPADDPAAAMLIARRNIEIDRRDDERTGRFRELDPALPDQTSGNRPRATQTPLIVCVGGCADGRRVQVSEAVFHRGAFEVPSPTGGGRWESVTYRIQEWRDQDGSRVFIASTDGQKNVLQRLLDHYHPGSPASTRAAGV